MIEIKTVKIEDIKEYDKNAKLHPDWHIEKIAQSIADYGYNDPIAIDENNIIIEGHGRFKALKKLGFKKIKVIILKHLTELQKRAYILAHNKININTDFDIEKLQEELKKLASEGVNLEEYGMKIETDNVAKGFNEFQHPFEIKYRCPNCNNINIESEYKKVIYGENRK